MINIKEFGARSGCKCTEELQAAINEGVKRNEPVTVPQGEFIIGSLDLKSVHLILERGAVLKASDDCNDYITLPIIHNEMREINPVLYSLESDGLRISGTGCIDLNARAFFSEEREVPDYGVTFSEEQVMECTKLYEYRSFQPIFIWKSKYVSLKDFTVKDAPSWTFSFFDSENIRVSKLNIENDLRIPNNDGMHFCGCRKVIIQDCIISAGDDCIALSSIMDWDIPCEDFTISNCILESCSKAISLGYMHSIVRNVVISNCIIRNSHRGIAVMSSTGTGLVENITISNMVIETRVYAGNWWGNGEPLCMMAVYHNLDNCKFPVPKRQWKQNIRNILVHNLICNAENVLALIGEDKNIENIIIKDIVYHEKESPNRYLKGDSTVDLSPASHNAIYDRSQPVWCFLQDVGHVEIGNCTAVSLNGETMCIQNA